MHIALALVLSFGFVIFLGIALWWLLRTEESSEELHISSLTSKVMYGYDFPIPPSPPMDPSPGMTPPIWLSPMSAIPDAYNSHRRQIDYSDVMADYYRAVDAYFRRDPSDPSRVPPTKYRISSSEYPGYAFCFHTWKTFRVGDILPVIIQKRKLSGAIVSFQVRNS